MAMTSLSLHLAAAGGKLRAEGISPHIRSKFCVSVTRFMGSSVSSAGLV